MYFSISYESRDIQKFVDCGGLLMLLLLKEELRSLPSPMLERRRGKGYSHKPGAVLRASHLSSHLILTAHYEQASAFYR